MDTKPKVIRTKEELKISSLKKGAIHRFHVQLSDNSMGIPWRVPLIVIRGLQKGPVFGMTAALHGDELNGIFTIFKVMEKIDPLQLKGTLILLPITNVPAYLMNQRFFTDNVDLNRIIPGCQEGSASEMYTYYLVKKIIKKMDYLFDLHTASRGRVNSLYIRADLNNDIVRNLAYLQNPEIIVNKAEEQGTLRCWACNNGIPSITIEIGNPNQYQMDMIDDVLPGMINTFRYLNMIEGEVQNMISDAIICRDSYWIYSRKGGLVEVPPKLADRVKKGDLLAIVYDVFGSIIETIVADQDGIIIGKNMSPNCESGSRIIHLGVDMFSPEKKSIPANH